MPARFDPINMQDSTTDYYGSARHSHLRDSSYVTMNGIWKAAKSLVCVALDLESSLVQLKHGKYLRIRKSLENQMLFIAPYPHGQSHTE